MATGVVQRGWRQRHREGGGGGTERVAAAAQRGWRQWHIEGGRTAWAAHHYEWAACLGCEVHTVGRRRHADGVRGCARCVVMCQCVSGWCGYSWGMLESVHCVGYRLGQRWAMDTTGVACGA